MNIVDSSAWLEYFAAGKNAANFAAAIEDVEHLLVPTITLFEVFKKLLKELDEDSALRAMAAMQRGKTIGLTTEIAICAGKISQQIKLPMADSIILASAYLSKATLWTQDSDFSGIRGVKYFEKL